MLQQTIVRMQRQGRNKAMKHLVQVAGSLKPKKSSPTPATRPIRHTPTHPPSAAHLVLPHGTWGSPLLQRQANKQQPRPQPWDFPPLDKDADHVMEEDILLGEHYPPHPEWSLDLDEDVTPLTEQLKDLYKEANLESSNKETKMTKVPLLAALAIDEGEVNVKVARHDGTVSMVLGGSELCVDCDTTAMRAATETISPVDMFLSALAAHQAMIVPKMAQAMNLEWNWTHVKATGMAAPISQRRTSVSGAYSSHPPPASPVPHMRFQGLAVQVTIATEETPDRIKALCDAVCAACPVMALLTDAGYPVAIRWDKARTFYD